MNIFDRIKIESAPFRKKIALIDGDEAVTYEDLIDGALQVAISLSSAGVSRFHRIGVLCDDSIDYVTLTLAILSISAVVVPISPDLAKDEINQVIERIDLDFLISDSRISGFDGSNPLICEAFRQREFRLLQRASSPPDSQYFDLNPAFIRFSSGTTGVSKGVLLSHETIIDRTDAADKGLQITPDDTVLWVLSMSYHFVVTILLFLRRGATIVLCGNNLPNGLIDAVIRQNGTFIYASPFHYSLLAASDEVTPDSLKSVRMAISTAMKLPPQIAEAFSVKFGFELCEAYGIIEVGLPFIKPAGVCGKSGSVGRILPDYLIKLRDPDESGIGEILIRGKGTLNAYYSPWKPKELIFEDGWFNTGDLGRVDEDGYLFILGRKKDVINFVGMKIFATEVEAVINSFPGVVESLVYAQPHDRYGELPIAKIVLDESMQSDSLLRELKRFCYSKLTSYKVPKDFEIVQSMQRTASGKLKR
ncbi:MAG: acyl--CoA ligase [Geobacteraceae bacterium]|nr:acyl--CoA ligase [Geobacteraceae bacterium]